MLRQREIEARKKCLAFLGTGARVLSMSRYSALADAAMQPKDKTGRKRLGGSVLAGGAIETDSQAEGRILGNRTTSRRTPAQEQAIAEFDRSMGFGATDANGTLLQGGKSTGLGAKNANGTLKQEPVDNGYNYGLDFAENHSGSFGSGKTPGHASAPALPTPAPPRSTPNPALPATRGFDPFASAPSALASTLSAPARQRPARFESPVVKPSVADVAGPASVPAASAPVSVTPAPGADVSTSNFLARNPTPTPTPGPNPYPTPGRSLASGVSNSQAAGFQQPTQEKPIPETPNSPVMDVNEYDKKKTKFAGF